MQDVMAVCGGHKGSGLAIAIQLMGALAGALAHTGNTDGWDFLVIAMDPEMFRPVEEFKHEVDAYSEIIRESQPLEGHGPVRMPFDRSWQIREQTSKGKYCKGGDICDRTIEETSWRKARNKQDHPSSHPVLLQSKYVVWQGAYTQAYSKYLDLDCQIETAIDLLWKLLLPLFISTNPAVYDLGVHTCASRVLPCFDIRIPSMRPNA